MLAIFSGLLKDRQRVLFEFLEDEVRSKHAYTGA